VVAGVIKRRTGIEAEIRLGTETMNTLAAAAKSMTIDLETGIMIAMTEIVVAIMTVMKTQTDGERHMEQMIAIGILLTGNDLKMETCSQIAIVMIVGIEGQALPVLQVETHASLNRRMSILMTGSAIQNLCQTVQKGGEIHRGRLMQSPMEQQMTG